MPFQTFLSQPFFGRAGSAPIVACADSPVWDHRYNRLVYVDCSPPTLWIYDATANTSTPHPLPPPHKSLGFAAPTTAEEAFVCGSDVAVFLFNTRTALTVSLHTVGELPDRQHSASTRFTVGKVDGLGRLFTGVASIAGAGGLYSFQSRAQGLKTKPIVVRHLRGTVDGPGGFSSGFDWSPDMTSMYLVDAQQKLLHVLRYDYQTGSVAYQQALHQVQSSEEHPRGMCVDEDGHCWVAMWGGSRVVRIDPQHGKIVAEVRVPARLVTNCCFGGPQLSQLIVTTAGDVTEKSSGKVFVADVGVRGLPINAFNISGVSATSMKSLL